MTKRSGNVPSKKALQEIKRQLADAATFVRSREVTSAIQRVTFNELVAAAIKELVGDDSANLRGTVRMYDGKGTVDVPVARARVHGRVIVTKKDRINAMDNTIHALIDRIKQIDPQALADQLAREQGGDTRNRRGF